MTAVLSPRTLLKSSTGRFEVRTVECSYRRRFRAITLAVPGPISLAVPPPITLAVPGGDQFGRPGACVTRSRGDHLGRRGGDQFGAVPLRSPWPSPW